MRFLPLVSIMVIIFLFSHIPGKEMPRQLHIGMDKVLHVLAYATLAAAALWAWLPQITRRGAAPLWSILLFCLLYGISDEFHQSFISGRYSSFADIIADVIGAGLFLWGWRLWQRRSNRIETK
ncbi:MAG: VanZ family protein [Thermodesulfobacteriota bacterium]